MSQLASGTSGRPMMLSMEQGPRMTSLTVSQPGSAAVALNHLFFSNFPPPLWHVEYCKHKVVIVQDSLAQSHCWAADPALHALQCSCPCLPGLPCLPCLPCLPPCLLALLTLILHHHDQHFRLCLSFDVVELSSLHPFLSSPFLPFPFLWVLPSTCIPAFPLSFPSQRGIASPHQIYSQ